MPNRVTRSFPERKSQLAAALRHDGHDRVGLSKDTSNLFRDRTRQATRPIDVRSFDHVLAVRPEQGWVDAEGMTSYEALVEATLAAGVMPAVVPQLKTITIGGATAGVGIEATSFRYGLVHETIREMEILTGTGEIVLARPDNEARDLFFGFPNSYGTLGYALRLRAATIPVKPFVAVVHQRYTDAPAFFAALEEATRSTADFVDGVIFSRDELILSTARFVESVAGTSDYTFRKIYYRSLRERRVDYLTTRDYLWRWDTDWFWCSKHVFAQVPLIRWIYGRDRLNSRTYTAIMRWNARWGLTRALDALGRRHRETVIQDVDIPIEQCEAFLDFYLPTVGLLPVWVCPIGSAPLSGHFPLYPLRAGKRYVNFGFWDVVKRRQAFAPGFHNRAVERKVIELGGIKSLYSDSYFTPAEFDLAYGGEAWRSLKAKYDPDGRFGDLYGKCVLKH